MTRPQDPQAPARMRHGEDVPPLIAAVPMATAAVQYLLAAAGIRSLAIKGPAAAVLGVRSARTSHDVDLLVDPQRFDDALALLNEGGWSRSPVMRSVSEMTLVAFAVTLSHPRWPCSLDLHRRYLGFLASPQEVFDYFWGESTVVELAHYPVRTLSPAASTALLYLHAARDRPRREDAMAAAAIALRISEQVRLSVRDGLPQVAAATASQAALLPLAEALDVTLVDGQVESDPDSVRAWDSARDLAGHPAGSIVKLWRSRRDGFVISLWRHLVLSDEDAAYWAERNGMGGATRQMVTRARWRAVAKRALRWSSHLRPGRRKSPTS